MDFSFRIRAAARRALRNHGGADGATITASREMYRAYLDEFATLVADEADTQGVDIAAIGDGKIVELIRSVLAWIAANPDKFLSLIRGIIDLFGGLIGGTALTTTTIRLESPGYSSTAFGDRMMALRKVWEFLRASGLDLETVLALWGEAVDLFQEFSVPKLLAFLQRVLTLMQNLPLTATAIAPRYEAAVKAVRACGA